MPFAQYNGNNKGTSQWGSSSVSSPKDEVAALQRQIDNATMRIQDAGFKPEDTDKRNWFEKLTNLPQGQNWFFDALDLLGRPAQAILNPIKEGMRGDRESVLKNAWKGFSGQERARGSEIAELGGINNKFGRFAIGTAIDIVGDPLTYVPGAILAKGIKGAAKTAAIPAVAGVKALETAVPRVKAAREAIQDGFGYAFKPGYKDTETLRGTADDFLKELKLDTENQRRFMQENALTDILKTAKETGIDAGKDVGRIMESPLKQFEDVRAFEFPDGLRRTERRQDLFDEVGLKRSNIREINKEIRGTQKEFDDAVIDLSKGMDQTDLEIRKLFSQMEREAAKTLNKEKRSNLREATRELKRIESQINNFGKSEESLLKHYKRQARELHDMKFDLAKQVRAVSPNGIKGVTKDNLPSTLHNHIKQGGRGIDDVANELGYQYADDLIRDLGALQGVPRRLGDDAVTRLARNEMGRSGALKELEQTKKALETTKTTLTQSIREIGKSSTSVKAEQRAFLELENNPRYLDLMNQRETLKSQKDSLFNESTLAREERLKQIKDVEREIDSLKEAARNPVTIQKEIARPQRELSSDPAIRTAAETLTRSNQMLRQVALDNGINIKEMEGYMTHVLSQAERDFRTTNKTFMVDSGRFGTGNPNKKILNERKLMGSTEDVNEQLGRNFFEPNAYFSTAIGQKRLIDYIQAAGFRKKVLSNPDFAVKYQKGMDIPSNGVVIDTNKYTFLKESGDILEGMATETVGGRYVVTKAVKQALDRFQHINTDEGTKAILKTLNGAQSMWKKLALFSPGYHVRNFMGNLWNSYAIGMRPDQLVKYTGNAVDELQKALRGSESAVFKEFRQQGLLMSGLTKVEMASFGSPEKAIEKTVKKMSKSGGQKALDKLKNPLDTSRELGEHADAVNRFALYKWARDNGQDAKNAAETVRKALFDYADLTQFEQKYMKAFMPFYTWSRKNIPYQLERFINDPQRFQKLNYTRLNAQENVGLDEENLPDYMKENFYMPLFGKDGKGKMLSLNLPAGDLAKVRDPLKMVTDLASPLIKTPIELASNYNTFRRKPIKRFEGQEKKFDMFGLEFGLPVQTAYALEQLTGQVGRGFSTMFQDAGNVDQENAFMNPSLGIGSFVKPFDAERYDQLKKLDELRKLQDLILYIEQQEGAKPRTVQEIKRGR